MDRLQKAEVEDFRAHFQGDVLLPDDAGYEEVLEFQLHPVGPDVLSGLIVFPFEQAKSVLTQFARFTETMPDELNVWMVTGEDERCIAWARDFFAKSQPFASGGAYINFLTQEETDRIAFAYGATYSRLVALKKKYDPTNLFRMNQNIKPV